MSFGTTGATPQEKRDQVGSRTPIRKRISLVSLFVLTQVAALFIIVELSARAFDPLGISYYPETARLLDEMIIEEPVGYRLPPGLDGEFYGTRVKINSLGMRDREVPTTKEPGEYRILIIGDSIPFSIGVDYEDSIPFQLERIANSLAPPGRRYRTLNMGVPSYNTEQELVQLQTTGMSLDPDVAVLIFVPNDIEPKMWVIEKRTGALRNLTQRSYAISLGFFLYQRAKRQLGETTPGNIRLRGIQKESPGWKMVDASLTGISQILKEAGVPFLLVYRGLSKDASMDKLRDVGNREGFPVHSLAFSDDPRFADLPFERYWNSDVDKHCNPEGCRIWATLLHRRLAAAGMLR